MGATREFLEKYQKAKIYYLNNIPNTSITKTASMFNIDRAALSRRLRSEGIEIINYQNLLKFNNKFFDKIDTEEKAYWLGFLYADGAISKDGRNIVELSLKSSDINHLEKFKSSLGFKKEKHIFQDDIRCRIEIVDKHTRQQLIFLGCTPRKSLTLTFPTEEQVPFYLLPHFLRGYMDGDGSVYLGKQKNKNGTVKEFPRLSILGTHNFLSNAIEKMNWPIAKIRQPSGAYAVEWAHHKAKYILDTLYQNATIYLDRKMEKYQYICRL